MNNELKSVSARISEIVEKFITQRLLETNTQFTADQLRFYVNMNVNTKVAPGSADRILRNLRQKNRINYIVINRGKSLYQAVPVVKAEAVPVQG